jgi:hypothetical protein
MSAAAAMLRFEIDAISQYGACPTVAVNWRWRPLSFTNGVGKVKAVCGQSHHRRQYVNLDCFNGYDQTLLRP